MSNKLKATVKIAVTNPNNAAKDDAFSAADHSWLSENGSLKGNLAVLANDPGAASLWAVSASQPPVSGAIAQEAAGTKDAFSVRFGDVTYGGELTLNSDGTVGFDLSSLAGLIDSLSVGESIQTVFYYTARMANGTLSTSKVVVDITGANDGPTIVTGATDAAGTVTEATDANEAAGFEQTATGTIKFNDLDRLDNNHSASVSSTVKDGQGNVIATPLGELSLGTVNQTNDTVGWTFRVSDGALDHLGANDTLTQVYVVTVSDGNGGTVDQSITITLRGTNDGPVAVADEAAGTENQTLEIDVLANDTDVDVGDSKSLVSASAPQGQGSASISNGKVVFNPGADFNYLEAGATATVIVNYTMTDEHGAESSSTVTITITGTNDGPVAVADEAAGTENQTLEIDVLANDTDVDVGDSKSLVSASAPQGQGSASISNGKVVFNPGADFDYLGAGATATVIVSYTMKDEHGAESSSTVTITITGTNDAAEITVLVGADAATHDGVIVAGSVSEDTGSGIVEVDLGASDVDGSSVLSIVGSGQGTYGSWTLVDGLARYTLANSSAAVQALNTGEVRYDSVTVKTADGTEKTFKVAINGLNDAPAANGYVNIAANDFDLPSSVTSFNGHSVKPTQQGVSETNPFELENVASNTNTFVGSNSGDFIDGRNGTDFIHGAAGNDWIQGGNQGDYLYGGAGNDRILGSQGIDHIYGGSGNDTITGGNAADKMWGGTGADKFVFTNASDSNSIMGKSTIQDFSRVEGDTIDLAAMGIKASDWVGFLKNASDLKAGKAGYIVDAQGKITVIADTDGTAGFASGADFELSVLGTSNLDATDFVFSN
jgi:VCBS repeat-containing protein